MKDKKNRSFIIVIILFILALTFMTVGFAAYNKILNINGTATLKPDGKIYIKNVVVSSKTENATVDPDPVFSDSGITDFNLSFDTTDSELNTEYYAIYEITIANESSYDFLYNMPDYTLTVTKDGRTYSNLLEVEINGIDKGESIDSNTEKVITAKITFSNPDINNSGIYEVNGEFTPNLKEDTVGRLIGNVNSDTIGDLTGTNETARFTVNVMSTYDEAKTFTITVADTDKYIVVDENGQQNNQYEISANNPGQDFTFYLKKANGEFEFNSEIENVKILVVPTGESGVNVGNVKVRVDTNGDADTVAPTISNVTVAYNNIDNQLLVSWQATDNSGDEALNGYTVIPYKKNGDNNYTAMSSITVDKAADINNKSITISSLTDDEEKIADGTYYFIVYGKDTTGNTATAREIQDAKTTPGHACRSADFEAQWEFTVTFRLTGSTSYINKSNNSTETAYRFTDYTTEVRSNSSSYTCSVDKVTMGNRTLKRDTDYSYSNNRYLTINQEITGNIEVSASASYNGGCLLEGTKILLADGKYKNIEDIRYTDLLAVYDHINGGITNVYPIWIEKKYKGFGYLKITFDDGTCIKAFKEHCLFDVDKKEYVDVFKEDQFGIGSRVYKIEDGKLKIITTTNIENIQEEIYYYDVMSTTYYNVIANDLITTDTFSQNMNYLYMFDENAIFKKWDEVSSGKQLEAKDFNMPEYIFKGANLNNTANTEGKYTSVNQIADSIAPRTLKPITNIGKAYFMMTTSLDKANRFNVYRFLYREGSTYILPTGNVKYYIETSTNKKYMPGDTVKVEYSMHFKAIQ
ncbi:MAG: hypothetical protein J6O41_04035 [Clostridia bacterium]|nr:hypothetical protein [Clostridia bacterium]